jgi:hypothetical protein
MALDIGLAWSSGSDILFTRHAKGFQQIDSFLALQFQLLKTVHQCLLGGRARRGGRQDSGCTMVTDLIQGCSPTAHRLALVPLRSEVSGAVEPYGAFRDLGRGDKVLTWPS